MGAARDRAKQRRFAEASLVVDALVQDPRSLDDEASGPSDRALDEHAVRRFIDARMDKREALCVQILAVERGEQCLERARRKHEARSACATEQRSRGAHERPERVVRSQSALGLEVAALGARGSLVVGRVSDDQPCGAAVGSGDDVDRAELDARARSAEVVLEVATQQFGGGRVRLDREHALGATVMEQPERNHSGAGAEVHGEPVSLGDGGREIREQQPVDRGAIASGRLREAHGAVEQRSFGDRGGGVAHGPARSVRYSIAACPRATLSIEEMSRASGGVCYVLTHGAFHRMNLIQTEEAARRLARAIASDLSLYNEAKIVQGIIDDNLFEVLAEEIEEGRALYKNRVAPELVNKNFYGRAIVDILIRAKRHIKSKVW